jgi:hypothetical protein
MIYIKSLIRNSILYAAEAMYSVKEIHYRALESTEENVLIKVFGTLRRCPRHLIYLEAGMVPARYQVQRQVLYYLQYILQQPTGSILYRIFDTMRKNPTKGDWASSSIKLVKTFDLNLNLKEIQDMKTSIYRNLVRRKMHKIAFNDLLEIQKNKEKGKYIKYDSLQMADYLLPEAQLNVSEKLDLFALRTEMNMNPNNFGRKIYCEKGCQEEQSNFHIYNCFRITKEETEDKYENILNGTLKQKIQTFQKFKEKIGYLITDIFSMCS